jgi:hypothetical protein
MFDILLFIICLSFKKIYKYKFYRIIINTVYIYFSCNEITLSKKHFLHGAIRKYYISNISVFVTCDYTLTTKKG